jgi:thiol-disulfide isomerase/thioredoxin
MKFHVRQLLFLIGYLALALFGSTGSLLAQAQNGQATQRPAATTKQSAPISYTLPQTNDTKQLVSFLSRVLDYQPKTESEAQDYDKRAPAAMNAAAERILQLEKDKNSPTYRFASKYLLAMRLMTLDKATRKDKVEIYQQIQTNLSGPQMDADDLDMAVAFADGLEAMGDVQLAAQVYHAFATTLAKNKEPLIVDLAKSLAGASRRLQLPGNPIQVAGTTIDGRPFDWKTYRGKVVLIDFWATWCGPCRAELPNLRKLKAQYGQSGFEVVSISVDEDRAKLDAFLQQTPMPWVVLHSEKGRNATAEYYGVNTVPTAILVDRAGRVVSLDARGKRLEEQLIQLMGQTARAR